MLATSKVQSVLFALILGMSQMAQAAVTCAISGQDPAAPNTYNQPVAQGSLLQAVVPNTSSIFFNEDSWVYSVHLTDESISLAISNQKTGQLTLAFGSRKGAVGLISSDLKRSFSCTER